MGGRDDLPVEALAVAAAAVVNSAQRGHRLTFRRWRRLSPRMWGCICPSCGCTAWVARMSSLDGQWRAGGTATKEPCEAPLPEDVA